MNRSTVLAAVLTAGLALAPFGDHVIADEQLLFGYSAESSRAERQWEEKLRAIPSTDNLRAYMQRLSARPHNIGSPYDKDNAEWIAAKFKEFGLDTHIEQFDVLFPTPKERAVGCLIYSDPHEDGFVPGETFPKGAYRPPDGVQRGSVADMPYYPGDPLTPGVGATKDAKRLKIEEAPTITKIPVLPVSYADAQPLLAALTGRVAPEGWRGGLGITYHVGPGPAKVHLKVKSDWSI